MGEIIGKPITLEEKLAWGERNRRLLAVESDEEEYWEHFGNSVELATEMPNLADGLYCEWPRV